MINSELTESKVAGLYGIKKMKVAAFKEMEDQCKKDYHDKENKYPDWNFQENNLAYPKKQSQEFNNYHKKRLKKI